MIKRLLFETRLGEHLLTFLERKVGLAVVDADWVGLQRSGEPTTAAEAQ
jgi:hypothetical protein